MFSVQFDVSRSFILRSLSLQIDNIYHFLSSISFHALSLSNNISFIPPDKIIKISPAFSLLQVHLSMKYHIWICIKPPSIIVCRAVTPVTPCCSQKCSIPLHVPQKNAPKSPSPSCITDMSHRPPQNAFYILITNSLSPLSRVAQKRINCNISYIFLSNFFFFFGNPPGYYFPHIISPNSISSLLHLLSYSSFLYITSCVILIFNLLIKPLIVLTHRSAGFNILYLIFSL